MIAPDDVANLQTWTRRVAAACGSLQPASKRIEVRTEFSGACTFEAAIAAAAHLCSDKSAQPEITFCSVGDISRAAQEVARLNHPTTCRFGNIMSMASPDLEKLLTDELCAEAPLLFAQSLLDI